MVLGVGRVMLPVVVDLDFLESPVRRVVLLEVAHFGVDFSEEERRVESETDFTTSHSFDGDGTALILICRNRKIISLDSHNQVINILLRNPDPR